MANIRFCYKNYIEQLQALLLNGPAVNVAQTTCTTPSTTITRPSGSFITDGVKRWSLLSGTMAASWPANTRVQTVGATSLTMNKTSTGAQTNVAATFTPTEPLTEDANYPMANVMNAQRYTPWDPGSGFAAPGSINFEFDLTVASPITAFGVQAMRWVGGQGIDELRLLSASTYGTWTLRATVNPIYPTHIDHGTVFSAQNFRFWRVELDYTVRIVIGGLFVGELGQDMGFGAGVGTTQRAILPVAVQRVPGGAPFMTALGDSQRRIWSFNWAAMTNAARGKIESAHNNVGIDGITRRSPILIDDADRWWEGDFVDRTIGWMSRFVNVDQVGVDFESYP